MCDRFYQGLDGQPPRIVAWLAAVNSVPQGLCLPKSLDLDLRGADAHGECAQLRHFSLVQLMRSEGYSNATLSGFSWMSENLVPCSGRVRSRWRYWHRQPFHLSILSGATFKHRCSPSNRMSLACPAKAKQLNDGEYHEARKS